MEERSRYDDEDMESMGNDSSARPQFKLPEHNVGHVPRTPSPLGLSNYDAIDLEGDPYDDGWDEPSEDLLNSDFNKREPFDTAIFNKYGHSLLQSHPDSHQPGAEPLAKDLMELVTDEEKQQEVSFAQF